MDKGIGSIEFEIPVGVRHSILHALRQAIVSGQLKPGQRITERHLSKTFGISTTPIKEALQILGTEGLVQTVPRKGTFVWQFALLRLSEMYRIRAVLEGVAAYLAAENATDDELLGLKAQFDNTTELLGGDYQKLIEENTRLHVAIRQASHNYYLQHLIDGIVSYDMIFRKVNLSSEDEQVLGWKDHKEVVDALLRRDAIAAESLLRGHIIRSGDRVVGLLATELQSAGKVTTGQIANFVFEVDD